MRHLVQANGNFSKLHMLRQRYRIKNAFWDLPFGDRDRNIFGATAKEPLHVLDNGLYEHQAGSFHDILGLKDAGKKEKNYFNKLFKVICCAMDR